MVTLQEIANVFNDNFRRLSGKGAKIGRLNDGQYVAICEGQEVVFPVRERATTVQLVSITEPPARALWKALEKNGEQ